MEHMTDANVLAHIKNNPGCTFLEIHTALKVGDRWADRQLQKLRKAGKITYTRADGWRVT